MEIAVDHNELTFKKHGDSENQPVYNHANSS